MIVANTRETWFKRPVAVMHQKEPDEDGSNSISSAAMEDLRLS